MKVKWITWKAYQWYLADCETFTGDACYNVEVGENICHRFISREKIVKSINIEESAHDTYAEIVFDDGSQLIANNILEYYKEEEVK